MYADILKDILVNIVKHPYDVYVEEIHDDMGILLMVNTNKEDMGSVIGKLGATAKAIRHIIRVIGMKNQHRISVKINEPS